MSFDPDSTGYVTSHHTPTHTHTHAHTLQPQRMFVGQEQPQQPAQQPPAMQPVLQRPVTIWTGIMELAEMVNML